MNKINGVVVGTVKSVDDPQHQGRVELVFDWLPGKTRSFWAPVAGPMSGNGRGAWFMPEVGDEVLVAFQHGDTQQPYIIGFTWNGVDKPPSSSVHERMIRSVNGHTIRFLDSTPDGGSLGALVIEDAHGNRITMSNGTIVVQSVALLQLSAPQIILKGPGYTRVVSQNNNPI